MIKDFNWETSEILVLVSISKCSRLLYPAKLLFKMEGQIKCIPDKVKLKEFIINKPLLYEC